MATSGQFSFAVTTFDIITLAAKFLGKLGEDENLTPSEYQDSLKFLNMLTKQWIVMNDSSQGLKTWLRHQGYMFLNANSGTYTLSAANGSYWTENFISTLSAGNNAIGATTINVSNSAGILENDTIGIQCDDGSLFWSNVVSTGANTVTIGTALPVASVGTTNIIYDFTTQAQPPQVIEAVVLRDSMGNDTPVQMLNLEDYFSLPSKAAPNYYGDPIAIYAEYHLIGTGASKYVKIFTDVAGAQDTSKYLVLSYLQEMDDFVNLNDNACFPGEWQMALVLNLAKHIAPMFNAVWSSQQDIQARDALIYARKSHRKTSTRGFEPGMRGGDSGTLQWR